MGAGGEEARTMNHHLKFKEETRTCLIQTGANSSLNLNNAWKALLEVAPALNRPKKPQENVGKLGEARGKLGGS